MHLELTVYGYSGGVVAFENTTFLATAAECCICNCKFFLQLPAKLLYIALTVYGYSGDVVAPENTTFLATAAECSMFNLKFYRYCDPWSHLEL